MPEEIGSGKRLEFGVGFNVSSGSGITDITSQIEKFNQISKEMSTSVNSAMKTLAKLNDEQDDFGKTTDKTSKKVSSFATEIKNNWGAGLTSSSDALKALNDKAKELQSTLKNKTNAQGFVDDAKLQKSVAELKNVQNVIKTIESSVQSAYTHNSEYMRYSSEELKNLKKQDLDNIKDFLAQKESEEKASYKRSVKEFQSATKGVSSSGAGINDIFDTTKVNAQLSLFKRNLVEAGLQLFGVRSLAYAFYDLSNQIVGVNYNVINNQRLMGDYSDRLRSTLIQSAVEIARQTGIQVTDAQEIQGAWIRINDEYAKSPALLNKISLATAKFMNVGEITDAEEAVKLVNSSMLQFNLTVDEGIQVLNKWAYMADKTAMGTADEYGQALSKIGGFMTSIGGSMDDAIVMTSILGDRLAKSGDEAGNSLKTILAYLTRTKTSSLFDQIVQETGDASYSLKTASGEFKDFTELMDTASRAYAMAQATNNDTLAKSIQEAIGATRQGDVAITLLKNWATESPKYYQMIQDSVSGTASYLDQQNETLMGTLKNQWNALYATIIDVGTAFGNAGIIQGITTFMGLLDNVGKSIASINPSVMKTIVSIGAMTVSFMALKKITSVTAVYNDFVKTLQYGTAQQREAVAEMQNATEAYIQQAIQKQKTNELSKDEVQEVSKQAIVYKQLRKEYEENKLTVEQYQAALKNLQSKFIQLDTVLSEEQAKLLYNNVLNEAGIETTNAQAAATERASIASRTRTAGLFAETLAQNALNAAKSAFSLLLDPITLITAGIGITAKVFTDLSNATENEKNKVDEIKNSIADLKKEIDELNAKAENGTINTIEETRLGLLKEQLAVKQRLIEEENKQLAHDEVFGANLLDSLNSLSSQGDNALNQIKSATGGIKNEEKAIQDINDRINLFAKDAERAKNSVDFQRAVDSQYSLSKQIDKSNEKINEFYSNLTGRLDELVGIRDKIKLDLDSGYLTGADATKAEELVQSYNEQIDAVKQLTGYTQENTTATEQQQNAIEGLQQTLNQTSDTVSTMSGYFNEYNEKGYLSLDTVAKMLDKYPEYAKYLVKEGDQYKLNMKAVDDLNASKEEQVRETDELISKQNEQSNSTAILTEDYKNALKASDEYINAIKNSYSDVPGMNEFADKLKSINSDFLNGKSNTDEYNQAIKDLISNSDFSQIANGINDASKAQQAQFATLANDVAGYLRESTEAFANGDIGAQEYCNTLNNTNSQLLDMRVKSEGLKLQDGKWVNASGQVDTYANSLQNAIDKMNSMSGVIGFLGDNYSVLSEIQTAVAQGQVDDAWWAAEQSTDAFIQMYNGFSSTMGSLHTTNKDAWTSVANTTASAMGVQVEDIYTANGDIKDGVQLNAVAMNAGVNQMTIELTKAVDQAAAAGASTISTFGEMIKNFKYTIKATPYIGTQEITQIQIGPAKIPVSLPSFNLQVSGEGGDTVQNFANSLSNFGSKLSNVDFSQFLNLGSFSPKFKPSNTASIGDSSFTPAPIAPTSSGSSGSSSSSSPRSSSSYTAPSSSSSSSGSGSSSSSTSAEEKAQKAAEDAAAKAEKEATQAAEDAAKAAQKAAEEAKKAAEEEQKAIESFTNKYTSNVTSFFTKTINALKSKYQELYDKRKKQLEDERKAQTQIHDDRISQLQAEVDKLEGTSIEDKEGNLASLKSKLQEWMQDNSTLGKSKQADLTSQITDLEKEIKIDKLKAQIDEENKIKDDIDTKYDNLENKDSGSYDTVLSSIDKLMSDKALADEASNLIRNNKMQDILDLLGEYAPDYDNYSYLMGSTLGQIVGEEIKTALANYQDLKANTITKDGGKNSNAAVSSGLNADLSKVDKNDSTIESNRELVKNYEKTNKDVSLHTSEIKKTTEKTFTDSEQSTVKIFTDMKVGTDSQTTQMKDAVTNTFTRTKDNAEQIFKELDTNSTKQWDDITKKAILSPVEKLSVDINVPWNKMYFDSDASWKATNVNATTLWTQLNTTVMQIVTDMATYLASQFILMRDDSNARMTETRDNIIARAIEMRDSFNARMDEITAHLNSMPPQWYEAGAAMIHDLNKGLNDTITGDNPETTMDKLATAMITKFKDRLGIHSPSRVMQKLGWFMMQGLINGLTPDEVMKLIDGTIDDMEESYKNGNLNITQTVDELDEAIPPLVQEIGVKPGDASSLMYPLIGTQGEITSPFGYRGEQGVGTANHEGIDIGAPSGTPVAAAMSGTVVQAGVNGGYGNFVAIDHGNGYQTSYGHLSAINVAPGQAVTAGQNIGAVGSTGWSTGPHLHFNLIQDGQHIDPAPFLAGASISSGSSLASALMTQYNIKHGLYNFAGGVTNEQVAAWIMQALIATGQSPSLLPGLVDAAMHESGGIPTAINNWDFNAAKGTPSKGLLQTIDPTFNAYKLPGHDDIFNPVDNAIAAIRYMIAEYGSVEAVLGPRAGGWYGYANGGLVDRPTFSLVGEDGPELIVPLSDKRRNRRRDLLTQTFGADAANMARFNTGGFVGNNEGIAYIDVKERILSAQQTQAFDSLVYDFMPKLSTGFKGNNIDNSSSKNVQFNKELVSVRVDKIENHTEYDTKNMESNLNTVIKKGLQKSGINWKK